MLMDKNDFLSSLDWCKNTRTRIDNKSDISITLCSDNRNVSIVFRNGTAEKISKVGTFKFAKFKNRLIFADATGEPGFVMSKNNKSHSKYAKFCYVAGREYIKEFIGDFELKRDDFYDVYYIEAK